MKDYFDQMNAQPGVEVNIMPVVGDSSLLKLDESQLPDAIPVLALRNAVVFPGTVFIDWFWRLAYGIGELDQVKWLVSSGVDSWGPPVRIGSDTEVWFLRFVPDRL